MAYRRRALARPILRVDKMARRGAISGPGRSGRDDKNEGAMDRAKGRMKEAGGALTGEKGKKREGR